jgi:hypothetical protein
MKVLALGVSAQDTPDRLSDAMPEGLRLIGQK